MVLFRDRVHLIEFHEQTWFPETCRRLVTDSLRALWLWKPLMMLMVLVEWVPWVRQWRRRHAALVERSLADLAAQSLAEAISEMDEGGDGTGTEPGPPVIVDLCSGGGGPISAVQKRLAQGFGIDTRWLLTDLFPNVDAWEDMASRNDSISYVRESTDALDCDLPATVRTMFASFHHFTPELAQGLLADAVRKRQAIAVFEITHNSPLVALLIALFAPVGVLLVLAKRCTMARLLAAPLAMVTLGLDGIVSCLRTYSVKEMRVLQSKADPRGEFIWEVKHAQLLWPLPIAVGCWVGRPRGDDE